MKFFSKPLGALLAGALLAGMAGGLPALAQNITVQVNGQTLGFTQPPVMRNGRVFVPMRAIFQRLGATVAYSNGVINANGNGRAVHLVIGSPNASVNGSPLTMDVAPFVVAGSTEVPLRFVAQALGATVNWNGNTDTVAITANNSPANQSYTPQAAQAPVNASFYLENEHPGNGARALTTHPAIHATFSEPVNRDTLRVSIDGRDLTSLVYANPEGFDVTPNFELAPGSHRVSVTGQTQAGAQFNTGWSFHTQGGAAANSISGVTPSPGSRVASNFTLSGHTLPNSRVHIVASGETSALGGLLQIGTGTFQTDVTADSSGHFSVPITLNAVSGGQLRVIVTATSPDGASIERSIVYST